MIDLASRVDSPAGTARAGPRAARNPVPASRRAPRVARNTRPTALAPIRPTLETESPMPDIYRGRRISTAWDAKQLRFDLRIAGKFVLWHTPNGNSYSRKLARDPEAKAVALEYLRRWIDMADERGPDAFGPEWFVGAPARDR